MRAVLQRVANCRVTSDGILTADIKSGLLVLLGIEASDTDEDINWLAEKIVKLRIFGDEQGLMNLSVLDINADIVLVSQFTLHAAVKKGARPSFIKAARPEQAIPLYEKMKSALAGLLGKNIQCGVFGADMKVELLNDGPVTIIIDTKSKE